MCLFSEEVSQNASRADVPESQNVGGGQLELLATLEILLEPTSTAHRVGTNLIGQKELGESWSLAILRPTNGDLHLLHWKLPFFGVQKPSP